MSADRFRFTVPPSDVARWTSATRQCVVLEIVNGWAYGRWCDVVACEMWACTHPDHGAPVRPVEV